MHLLEHFKELTIHPRNAEELKGLILQLAIEGKLTKKWREQHPVIEPASILLKRIQKEKAKLVREKRIPKSDVPLEISEGKKMFELPTYWQWVSLISSVHLVTKGATPTTYGYCFQSSGINFIKIESVKDGEIKRDLIESYISQEAHLNQKRSILEEGDILFSIAGTIGATAIVKKSDLPANTNQALAIVRGSRTVYSSKYLQLLFDSFVTKSTREKARGAAMNNISLGDLKEMPVPVAPKEEQKAIVEIVNQLFQEVEALEEQTRARIKLKEDFVTSALLQLTNGDTKKEWAFLQNHFKTLFTEKSNVKKLREAVLQLAVQGKLTTKWRLANPNIEPATELLKCIKAEKEQLVKEKKIKKEKPLPAITKDEIPYGLPDGWVWCRLGSLVKSMTNGLYKPAKYYTDNGIVSLRMFNIQNGKIDFKGARKVEVTSSELTTYQLEENDLLINRVNSHELIGKTAIIPMHHEDLVYESMNIRTILFFKDKISHYLNMFLQSEGARAYLMTSSKQAIGQASINQTIISSLLIPFPPIEEQKAIVEKVNALMAFCDELENEIENNNRLVEDLMKSSLREVLEG